MSWLRGLLARRRLYDDLSDEIRTHLEEMEDNLVAQGMSRGEARAAARRAFGNVTRVQETGRDVWEWPALDSVAADVRFALRQLRRSPAVTVAAILTLGIGIAANATVFSWTRAVLLNPLPGVEDAGRVVAVEGVAPSGDWTPMSFSDFQDLERTATSLGAMAVAYPTGLVVGDGESAERRLGEVVSGRFFDVLGVRPQRGRLFSPAESGPATGMFPVVVISHALWSTRYQSDSSVIGSVMYVNHYPFTVIGVTPDGFRGSLPGSDRELWVLATMFGEIQPNGISLLHDRKTRLFRTLARLAPGAGVAQANAEVQAIAARLAEVNPRTNQGMSASALPLWRSHYGPQDGLRAPLVMLTVASAVLLLIVCANLANLLLTRVTSRRKELNLRVALGAPRTRIVRQLLTEAAVLAVGGTALGLAGATWLSGSLSTLVPAFAVPGLIRPRVDTGVLIFVVTLACAVTLVAGIAPALHGARKHLGDALRTVGRGTTHGPGSRRLRHALVMCEMAIAVVCLVAAGLFVRTFQRVSEVPPGFDPRGVAVGSVSLSTVGYDAQQADAFLRQVRERLERRSDVSAVSYSDYLPLSVGSGSWEDLEIEGYAPRPDENMKLYRTLVAPGFFSVVKIPFREGRDFTLLDDSTHTPAMIVNEEFVRRYFRGGAAIGRKVRGWGHWFTIVGVVADSKVYRLSERPTPYFYVPMRQIYRPEFPYTFLVRTTRSVDDAVQAIRTDVRAVDPRLQVGNAMSLEAYIAAPLARQKAAAVLLSVAAAIAFLLAAIGLYGVTAETVTERTREIGVRLAIGAHRSDIWQLIMGQAARLLVGGVVVGIGAAALLSRYVTGMLFGIGARDPLAYGVAVGCVVAVAILAAGVTTHRALMVDPLIALRGE
jgi:predicted permease